MKHPVRSVFLAAGLGFALVLSSCSGPGDDPAPDSPASTSSSPVTSPSAGPAPAVTSPPTSSAPDDDGSSAALTTFSGAREDVQYSFDHPSDWTVEESLAETDPDYGAVTIRDPGGGKLAVLNILGAWGAECPCEVYPAVYLGDWAGAQPLSLSGPFVARSMAVDLSEYPSERARNKWANNVNVVTSMTSASAPQTAMVPSRMYGLGLVDTEAVASNGITRRTVLFIASRDFETLREARDYVASDEHRQIQAMIASFREQ